MFYCRKNSINQVMLKPIFNGANFVAFCKKTYMSDNLKKTAPQDAKKINVHEKHEMEYWTQTLGLPRDKLISIVEKVGPSVEAVRKALKNRN